MIRFQWKVSCVFVLAVLAFMARPAGAQGTAFMYQGHLRSGGVPANGLHDFRFRLFDAPAGGAQLGATVCSDSVPVIDGVFNILLDFGDQFVTTDTRHLEIHVRQEIGQPCTDDFGYVPLAPRQPITAAPVASHANHASLADAAFALTAPDGSPADAVIVDNAGNVGIGTTSPQQRLHVNGGLRWGGTTDQAWSDQDGLGLFLEQTGSSPATSKIRLQTSKSGDFINYSQFFIDPNAGFSFMSHGTGNGNIGIGTTLPQAKIDVRGDIRLGQSGELHAPGGVENLRIIRGAVGANGAILRGSGFTSQRNGIGFYRVTFDTPFADVPTITAITSTSHTFVTLTGNFASEFDINVANSEGSLSDASFNFIAIGSR